MSFLSSVCTCWCFLKAKLKNKTDVSCSVDGLSLSLQFVAISILGCSSLGFRLSGVSWTWEGLSPSVSRL